jgi:hypothetical protein
MNFSQKKVAEEVTKRVFQLANSAEWPHLTIEQRAGYYQLWTEDPRIGGQLRKIMGDERVRVYLKDTIIGAYNRSRKPSVEQVLRSLQIRCGVVQKKFVKPDALLCDDRNLYTLSAAKDWKVSLINSFLRAQDYSSIDTNILYLTDHMTANFVDARFRETLEDCGKRLGVDVEWLR